jgi:hypothetical protein
MNEVNWRAFQKSSNVMDMKHLVFVKSHIRRVNKLTRDLGRLHRGLKIKAIWSLEQQLVDPFWDLEWR